MKRIWVILGTVVATLVVSSIFTSSDGQPANARMFCAYDRIFVEFEEGKHRWGTIFLDDEGKPVPCSKKYFNLQHTI